MSKHIEASEVLKEMLNDAEDTLARFSGYGGKHRKKMLAENVAALTAAVGALQGLPILHPDQCRAAVKAAILEVTGCHDITAGEKSVAETIVAALATAAQVPEVWACVDPSDDKVWIAETGREAMERLAKECGDICVPMVRATVVAQAGDGECGVASAHEWVRTCLRCGAIREAIDPAPCEVSSLVQKWRWDAENNGGEDWPQTMMQRACADELEQALAAEGRHE